MPNPLLSAGENIQYKLCVASTRFESQRICIIRMLEIVALEYHITLRSMISTFPVSSPSLCHIWSGQLITQSLLPTWMGHSNWLERAKYLWLDSPNSLRIEGWTIKCTSSGGIWLIGRRNVIGSRQRQLLERHFSQLAWYSWRWIILNGLSEMIALDWLEQNI